MVGGSVNSTVLVGGGGAPTIQYKAIHGGISSFSSYGIYSDRSSPTISGNAINGGVSVFESYDIFNGGESPTTDSVTRPASGTPWAMGAYEP